LTVGLDVIGGSDGTMAMLSIAEKVTKQRKMKYNVNDDIYFTQQPKPDPGSGAQREPLL